MSTQWFEESFKEMRKTRERAGFRGEIRAVIWIYVFDALETAKTKR